MQLLADPPIIDHLEKDGCYRILVKVETVKINFDPSNFLSVNFATGGGL